MFEEAFGFDKSRDFRSDAKSDDNVPGMVVTGNHWNIKAVLSDPATPPFFGVSTWLNDKNDILEAIMLAGSSQSFEQYTAPQRILRELGAPSVMLTSFDVNVENVYQGNGNLILIYYDKGITISYPVIQISIERDSKSSPGVANLCLGSLPSSEGEYWVEVYFTRPFTNELNNLSPIQQYLIGDTIKRTDPELKPFQDVFGLSLENVTNLALEGDNNCVVTNVP